MYVATLWNMFGLVPIVALKSLLSMAVDSDEIGK